MRHNICLILFNLLVLSTVSGQLFEDGYLSFFERNIPPCQVMISKTYFGDDSLPVKTDTIRFDSSGNRIAETAYTNSEFAFTRLFRYNSFGDVIAEYYINDQRDTMVNFYSCSYVRNELAMKVSSSGITNITYRYNSKNHCDYIVSQGISDERKFIFGYPQIFKYEEYGNFNQLIKYKRNNPELIIKTESNGLQSLLYSEQYTIRFGCVKKCITTNYNGDKNAIIIKYHNNQPVKLISSEITIIAEYNKMSTLQELTAAKQGQPSKRILYEYLY